MTARTLKALTYDVASLAVGVESACTILAKLLKSTVDDPEAPEVQRTLALLMINARAAEVISDEVTGEED